MKRATITILIILLASLACMSTAVREEVGSAAASTPLSITGDTPEAPEAEETENPAGAVFDISTWHVTPQTRFCAIVIADEALHLRAEPSERAEHLRYLLAGEQVKVLDLGNWWKVETRSGAMGYANAKYLQEEKCK